MLEHVSPLHRAFYELLEHLPWGNAACISQQPAAVVTIRDTKIRKLTSNIKF